MAIMGVVTSPLSEQAPERRQTCPGQIALVDSCQIWSKRVEPDMDRWDSLLDFTLGRTPRWTWMKWADESPYLAKVAG